MAEPLPQCVVVGRVKREVVVASYYYLRGGMWRKFKKKSTCDDEGRGRNFNTTITLHVLHILGPQYNYGTISTTANESTTPHTYSTTSARLNISVLPVMLFILALKLVENAKCVQLVVKLCKYCVIYLSKHWSLSSITTLFLLLWFLPIQLLN